MRRRYLPGALRWGIGSLAFPHAYLRVPLSEGTHVRALPVDDCARAREVRRLRCEPGRDRALSGGGPLQGVGLLLDRLRQGQGEEGRRRRVGRRLVVGRLVLLLWRRHEEDGVVDDEERHVVLDEEAGRVSDALFEGVVAADAARTVRPWAGRRRLRRGVAAPHLDDGDFPLGAGDVPVAVILPAEPAMQ